MKELSIRAIEAADLEAIQQVALEGYGSCASSRLLQEAAEANEFAFGRVAVDGDGAICGFILWEASGQQNCYIDRLVVAPHCQRRGIGRKLMLNALESIAECGARTASLVVSHSNVGAIKLYTSLGFEWGNGRVFMLHHIEPRTA